MAAKKGGGMDMAAVFGAPAGKPKGPMGSGDMAELEEPSGIGEEGDEEGDAFIQEVVDALGIDSSVFIEAVKAAMLK